MGTARAGRGGGGGGGPRGGRPALRGLHAAVPEDTQGDAAGRVGHRHAGEGADHQQGAVGASGHGPADLQAGDPVQLVRDQGLHPQQEGRAEAAEARAPHRGTGGRPHRPRRSVRPLLQDVLAQGGPRAAGLRQPRQAPPRLQSMGRLHQVLHANTTHLLPDNPLPLAAVWCIPEIAGGA